MSTPQPADQARKAAFFRAPSKTNSPPKSLGEDKWYLVAVVRLSPPRISLLTHTRSAPYPPLHPPNQHPPKYSNPPPFLPPIPPSSTASARESIMRLWDIY